MADRGKLLSNMNFLKVKLRTNSKKSSDVPAEDELPIGDESKIVDDDQVKPEGEEDLTRPEGEEDETKPEGEGEETKPEGEEDETKPEGEEDETKPEGEDEETKPEGEEDEIKPEGEDDSETSSDDSSDDSSSDSSSDSDSDAEFECKACDKKFSGYIPFKQHQKGSKHKRTVSRKQKEKKLKGRAADEEEEEGDFAIPEPYAVCKVCHKQFSGPESYHMHLKSKSHKQKVLEASVLQQVREHGEINADKLMELYKSKRMAEGVKAAAEANLPTLDDEKVANDFECSDCEKVFSGLMPFTQHLVSKTHAKQVERKKKLNEVTSEKSEKSKQKDLSTLSLEDDILVCKICTMSFSGPENAMMHLKSKKHSKNLDKHVRKLERKREKEGKKASSTRGEEPDKTLDKDQPSSSSTEPKRVDSGIPDGPTSFVGEANEELDHYHKYKE